jgi:hypothetical protein
VKGLEHADAEPEVAEAVAIMVVAAVQGIQLLQRQFPPVEHKQLVVQVVPQVFHQPKMVCRAF